MWKSFLYVVKEPKRATQRNVHAWEKGEKPRGWRSSRSIPVLPARHLCLGWLSTLVVTPYARGPDWVHSHHFQDTFSSASTRKKAGRSATAWFLIFLRTNWARDSGLTSLNQVPTANLTWGIKRWTSWYRKANHYYDATFSVSVAVGPDFSASNPAPWWGDVPEKASEDGPMLGPQPSMWETQSSRFQTCGIWL